MLSRKALGIFVFVLAEFYASALVIRSVGFGIAFVASMLLAFLGMRLFRHNIAVSKRVQRDSPIEGASDSLVASIANGALASVGAALLIIPGVISAGVGVLLLIPPIRSAIAPLVARRIAAAAPPQAMAGADMFSVFTNGAGFPGSGFPGSARRADPNVVDVDIVDDSAPTDRSNPTAESAPPELR